MALRLLLRVGAHRAERGLSVDLVQEARLDLIRPAAALLLALALAAPAQAQPLVPNPGLTSLLQPQRLDRSRPLVSEDRAAGTRSGLRPAPPPGATPCARPGAAASGGYPAVPPAPSLYGGGSGPGDYGRYIPGAPPPADAAGKKPGGYTSASGTAAAPAGAPAQPGATRTATADRPLYGGVDRPLWDTGERRPAAPGKPAPPGQAGKDPATAAPPQPNALPAPVRDRPLWGGGPADPAADPASGSTSTAGIGGAAGGPCTAASATPPGR